MNHFRQVGQDTLPYSASALSDSIAAKLAAAGLVHLEAPGALASADLVLSGTLALRNNRVVVTVELRQPGSPLALWTSSFWRDTTFGPTVDAVVEGVAGAIAAESARRALTRSKARG